MKKAGKFDLGGGAGFGGFFTLIRHGFAVFPYPLCLAALDISP